MEDITLAERLNGLKVESCHTEDNKHFLSKAIREYGNKVISSLRVPLAHKITSRNSNNIREYISTKWHKELSTFNFLLDFFHAPKASPIELRSAGSVLSLSGASAVQKSASAFTLAEVLITLGVIGVTAAIALPTLTENIREIQRTERQVNIVHKITQATNHMRALDRLGQFSTTTAFVNELKKYLKIAKICDSEHLVDCWPTEKVIAADGEEYEVKDATTGEHLGFKGRKTNNVGLVLADGASLILTYDPSFGGMSADDVLRTIKSTELPYGKNKTKVFNGYTTNTTTGLAFMMDVNGSSKPNSETLNGKFNDIRSFNGASFSKVIKPAFTLNGFNYFYVGDFSDVQLRKDYIDELTNGLTKAYATNGRMLPTSNYVSSGHFYGANGLCKSLGYNWAGLNKDGYINSTDFVAFQNLITGRGGSNVDTSIINGQTYLKMKKYLSGDSDSAPLFCTPDGKRDEYEDGYGPQQITY